MSTSLPRALCPILFLGPLLFSFFFAPLTFAQTNCTKYFGGEITCTGPGGYQAEGRQHLGGTESWYDNKGNSATVRHDPFGGTSIDTTRTDSGSRVPVFIPPSLPTRSGTEAPKESVERMLGLSSVPRTTEDYDYPQPILDKSKLPKTPEEYRLSVLSMKAVEEKDFVKAEELKQLLWQEQFKNATTNGRVHMFNEERAEKRLAMMRSLDGVEKRIRWENRPARLALFHRYKEKTLILFEEQEAIKAKAFQEVVLEWKDEDEGNARFAKLVADVAALKASELDPVEYQKKEEELLEQWEKAEDQQKRRKSAIIDAEISHMMAEENAQRKKTRK